jgi:hypothetical protein
MNTTEVTSIVPWRLKSGDVDWQWWLPKAHCSPNAVHEKSTADVVIIGVQSLLYLGLIGYKTGCQTTNRVIASAVLITGRGRAAEVPHYCNGLSS